MLRIIPAILLGLALLTVLFLLLRKFLRKVGVSPKLGKSFLVTGLVIGVISLASVAVGWLFTSILGGEKGPSAGLKTLEVILLILASLLLVYLLILFGRRIKIAAPNLAAFSGERYRDRSITGGLFLLSLLGFGLLYPELLRGWWSFGALYCLAGLATILALGMVAPRAGWFLFTLFWITILATYPWAKDIGKSAEAIESEPTTRVTTTKRGEWRVVIFYPQRDERTYHPAIVVEEIEETKTFRYYGFRSGKDDYGTIKLTKSGDRRWEGEWSRPGSWGTVVLTSDAQESHFTGHWSTPDSSNPEWQKGGHFQIIRQ